MRTLEPSLAGKRPWMQKLSAAQYPCVRISHAWFYLSLCRVPTTVHYTGALEGSELPTLLRTAAREANTYFFHTSLAAPLTAPFAAPFPAFFATVAIIPSPSFLLLSPTSFSSLLSFFAYTCSLVIFVVLLPSGTGRP